MTLQQAIHSQRVVYETLMRASTDVDSDVGGGLDDVNGMPVIVRFVPTALLNDVARQTADATCMMYENEYLIFLSEQPSPAAGLPSLTGDWLYRFQVLHEYGHIRNGDTFEEDPAAAFNRVLLAHRGDQTARHQFVIQEALADAYAAYRLREEAYSAGRGDIAAELEVFINDKELTQTVARVANGSMSSQSPQPSETPDNPNPPKDREH